jgi:hypothetical protein
MGGAAPSPAPAGNTAGFSFDMNALRNAGRGTTTPNPVAATTPGVPASFVFSVFFVL